MRDKFLCKLCGTEIKKNNRVKSHILTNAVHHKPLTKDGEHPLIFSKTFASKDANHYATDNTILCSDCDQMLGRYEDELCRFAREVSEKPKKCGEYIEVTGFDQEKIKLACLANIYRCSITSIPLFENFSLGSHEESIRKILLGEKKIRLEDYPIAFVLVPSEKGLSDGISMAPKKVRFEYGILAYETFMPGGIVWYVKVDPRPFPIMERVSLGSYDRIIVPVLMDFEKSKFLQGILKAIRRPMLLQ